MFFLPSLTLSVIGSVQSGCVYVIISIYLPAHGSCNYLIECLEIIFEVVKAREIGARIIICGDFNGDLRFKGGFRSQRPPTTQGGLIASFLSRRGLYAINM